MTDFLNINKNSKLFQKFISSKNSSNNHKNRSISNYISSKQSSSFDQTLKDMLNQHTIRGSDQKQNINIENGQIKQISAKQQQKLQLQNRYNKSINKRRQDGHNISKYSTFENQSSEQLYNKKDQQKYRDKRQNTSYIKQIKQINYKQLYEELLTKYHNISNQLQFLKISQREQGQRQIYKIKYQIGQQSIDLKKRIQECNIKMDKLNEENLLAKGYLYNLTIKLYHSEKLNGQLQKQIAALKLKNSQSQPRYDQKVRQRVVGQISEERLQKYKKNIAGQTECDQRNQIIKEGSNNGEQQLCLYDDKAQMSRRIQDIQSQLEQIYQMKFLNGKIRRRKIQLQRQLQELIKQ